MSTRLGDDLVLTPVSGGVTVAGSSGVPVTGLAAGPETDPEKTLPMPALTSWMLLRHALRLRMLSWWRPNAGLTLVAVAILVVLVALLLRTHNTQTRDADTRDVSQADSAAPAATATPAPPMPVHGAARTPVAAQEDPSAVAPRVPSAQEMSRLPKAVIGAVLEAAPVDLAPAVTPGTTVLHPTQDTAVYVEPGGSAFAVLPSRQVLTPTWVPVVDRRPGWVLVMLPTRPHPGGAAAVGWIYLQPTVELAEGDRRVEVDTATGRVSVLAELGGVTTYSPLGAARPAGTVAQTAPATGRRSFVAIGGQPATETSWLLRMLWPFAIDTSRVCTGSFTTVSVPGLPASSPLGSLDPAGCVPTPPALHSALTQVPAGAAVLLR